MEPITTEQNSASNQTKISKQNGRSKGQSVLNSMLIEITPTDPSDIQQQRRESSNLELDPYFSSNLHISSQITWKRLCAFIVYALLSMTVGIIIVCVTGSRKTSTFSSLFVEKRWN